MRLLRRIRVAQAAGRRGGPRATTAALAGDARHPDSA